MIRYVLQIRVALWEMIENDVSETSVIHSPSLLLVPYLDMLWG